MNVHAFEEKIDAIARFFLYVLIFWIPFSNAAIETCVVLVFVLWIAKRTLRAAAFFKNAQGKNKAQIIFKSFAPVPSILNLPIAVFLYICLLSAFWSRSPLASLHGLTTKMLEWFIVYFLALEFLNKEKYIKMAVGVFLFSAFSVCVDSLIQAYVTGKDIFCQASGAGRATACFSTGNDLGAYLLFVLPLAAALFLYARKNKAAFMSFFLLFLLALIAIFATLSRGAWLAFFVSAWIFLFLRKRYFSYLLILIFAVLAVDFFIILPSKKKDLIRITPQEVSSVVGWRKDLWIDSIKMIKDKPFLGHGPNTFMETFREKQYRRRAGGHAEYDPSYAHNCFIQMVAETGFLGFGCFLWILGRFFKNSIPTILRGQKENKNNFLVILLLSFISGAAGFLLHSAVDTHLYSLRLSVLFWVMIGISVSIYNLLSREANCDIKKA